MAPQNTSSINTLRATAVVTGSFLSGAMMSLSLQAVPVLLDTTLSAAQLYHGWTRMYHYGHQIMPALAIATFGLYAYTALRERAANPAWRRDALAGIVTLAMLPFTWLVMVPTNNALFARQAAGSGVSSSMVDAQELVAFWSWLHLARACFPLAGAALGLRTALRR